MMTKRFSHPETVSEIIQKYRGEQSLYKFSVDLGGVTGESVRLWEAGNPVGDTTLKRWWADPRPWVKTMAIDVLIANYPGLVEAILSRLEPNTPAAENHTPAKAGK